jgi:hypothetical protein
MKPAKDLVLKCRSTEYRCCCVASHKHNLLPFSTPLSYPLLSAESKAASAANNKERLGECHNIVWCHTIFFHACLVDYPIYSDVEQDKAR